MNNTSEKRRIVIKDIRESITDLINSEVHQEHWLFVQKGLLDIDCDSWVHVTREEQTTCFNSSEIPETKSDHNPSLLHTSCYLIYNKIELLLGEKEECSFHFVYRERDSDQDVRQSVTSS